MPLRHGYSYGTVQGNISELVRAGHAQDVAVAAAMSHARKDYFTKHPQGLLPYWLEFPKGARTRARYDRDGKPILANPLPLIAAKAFAAASHASTAGKLFSRNPGASPANLRKAAKLYADFTGAEEYEIVEIPVKTLPREGLVFGECLVIGYKSMRDGKPYVHEFRASSRPLLAASHDGKQVVIVGGRYAFTDRGIVDK